MLDDNGALPGQSAALREAAAWEVVHAIAG